MRKIALLLAAAVGLSAADASEDLLAAARAGDLTAVKAAIEKGGAIDAKTPYGQTPLYLAAMNGHEPVVRFLVEKGAAADVTDTFYKAPMLTFVLQRKHYDVAKVLIPKLAADQVLGPVASSGRLELLQTALETGKPSRAALNRAYENALQTKQPEISAALKKAGAQEPAPAVKVEASVLESYSGSYKSDQVPIEIKVFVRDGNLYLQASGQSEFAPKALSATRFEFKPAQLEVEFDTPGGFTLKQGSGTMKFKKAVAQ